MYVDYVINSFLKFKLHTYRVSIELYCHLPYISHWCYFRRFGRQAWGDNGNGQVCPTSSKESVSTPQEGVLPAGTTVRDAAAGAGYSLLLTATGDVFYLSRPQAVRLQLEQGAPKPFQSNSIALRRRRRVYRDIAMSIRASSWNIFSDLQDPLFVFENHEMVL